MANFTLKDDVDYSKLDACMGEDEVLIGFPMGIPHLSPDGTISDVAEDARKLSFGTDKIPARPFLEDGITDGQNDINLRIEKYYKKKMSGENALSELFAIGVQAVGSIQQFVRGDYYRSTIPNSDATIAAKSTRQKGKWLLSDTPLIDTAQMINSLTFIIRDRLFSKKKNDETGKKEWTI